MRDAAARIGGDFLTIEPSPREASEKAVLERLDNTRRKVQVIHAAVLRQSVGHQQTTIFTALLNALEISQHALRYGPNFYRALRNSTSVNARVVLG